MVILGSGDEMRTWKTTSWLALAACSPQPDILGSWSGTCAGGSIDPDEEWAIALDLTERTDGNHYLGEASLERVDGQVVQVALAEAWGGDNVGDQASFATEDFELDGVEMSISGDGEIDAIEPDRIVGECVVHVPEFQTFFGSNRSSHQGSLVLDRDG